MDEIMEKEKQRIVTLKDKMDTLLKNITSLKNKADELVKKIVLLKNNNVSENFIINHVKDINPDCDSEEMLNEHITHVEKLEKFLEAFIDELKKHYKILSETNSQENNNQPTW